jgi:hypothetical protein
MKTVVREIFFDHIAFVAKADHELVNTEMRVHLHDVPQDRPAADLDHGLRFDGGFLGNSGAESACENDRLHKSRPFAVEGTGCPANQFGLQSEPFNHQRGLERLVGWRERLKNLID